MKGENTKTNIVVKNDTIITSRMKDYTGVIFNNRWIGLRPAGRNYENRMLWEFRCLNCGKTIIRSPSNIKGCRCDCIELKPIIFKMSFYDWCKKNKHDDWIGLWDYELNKYDIHEVGYSSDNKYWFKCNNGNPNHHSEQYKLSNLTNGRQLGILCNQCNSFAQVGLDKMGDDFLNKYWDYDKNTIDPWDISRASSKKIWLKCPDQKHESHRTDAHLAYKYEYGCPYCSNESNTSKLCKKVINYIESLGYATLQEFNCKIIAKNPKTNHYLPYDIEIPDLKIIIEVQGEQHYEENNLFNKHLAKRENMTYRQSLEYRKWLDDYKMEHALSEGYNFLQIPYWTEKNEDYKVLINETINKANFYIT